MVRAVLRDATDAQLAWQPPGAAHSAGATYLHLLTAADGFVNRMLRGAPTLWDAGGWPDRLGVPELPRLGDWSGVHGRAFTLDALAPYQQAVLDATLAYAESLASADLDRPVDFLERTVPLADVLARVTVHTCLHAGEIASLRGAQGVSGLPF
ncbi:MAG: DinB family protein [Dehalococcoidia bacterium]|nr:DinB family protein [Dehalococcoidia bacterium]